MNILKTGLLLGLLTIPFFATAQTTLRFREESVRNLSAIWSLEIQQFNSSTQVVRLLAVIREKDAGEVYRARSPEITLDAGILLLNHQQIASLEVVLNRFPEGQLLPDGQYWIQMYLTEPGTDRELASVLTRTEISASGFDWRNIPETGNKNGRMPVHGRLRQSFQYISSGSPLYTMAPPIACRTEITTEFQTVGIPVVLQGVRNTPVYQQNGNQLGVRINTEAVKQKAMDWLQKRLSPAAQFDSLDAARAIWYQEYLHRRQFPEYDSWKEKFDSLQLEAAAHAVQKQDQLKKALASPGIQNQLDELHEARKQHVFTDMQDVSRLKGQIPDSLLERYSTLLRLEASCQRMQSQIETLEQQKTTFNKYKSLYNKVKSADKARASKVVPRNSDDLRKGLAAFGKGRQLSALLLGIDHLEIGSFLPFYSTQTLNGVRLNGANMAFTSNRNWHIGFTTGITPVIHLPDTLPVFMQTSFFKQFIAGIQAGIGRPAGNHLYLQHLRIKDIGNTAPPETEAGRALSRGENYVAGLAWQYEDKKRIVHFSGEANQGLFNPDRTAAILPTRSAAGLQSRLGIRARSGSALDLAYSARIQIQFPDGVTRLSASVQHVGPGYRSLGVPFLIRDITRFDFRASRDWKGVRLKSSLYVKSDFNQTSPISERYRTATRFFGAQLQGQFGKNVQWSADVAPYVQFSRWSGFRSRKGMQMMSSIQWQQNLQGARIIHRGTWLQQYLRVADSIDVYRIQMFQSSHQWTSKRMLFQISGVCTTRNLQNASNTWWYTADVSAAWMQLFKTGQATVGAQYIHDVINSVTKAGYCRLNLPMCTWLSLELNVRYARSGHKSVNQLTSQWFTWMAINSRW